MKNTILIIFIFMLNQFIYGQNNKCDFPIDIKEDETVLDISATEDGFISLKIQKVSKDTFNSKKQIYYIFIDSLKTITKSEVIDDINNKIFVRHKTIIYTKFSNNKWYVFKNNNKYGPFQSIDEGFLINEKNELSFAAIIDGKKYIITEYKMEGPFTRIDNESFLINTNKKVYIGYKENKRYVYNGNIKIGPFDYISSVTTPNGKRYTFIAEKKKKYYFYNETEKYGPYEMIDELHIRFSKDDNIIAYRAKRKGKWFIFFNQKEIGPFDYEPRFEISYDQKNIAYSVWENNKTSIFYNNNKIGTFDFINDIVFSKNGKPCYSFEIENKSYVMYGEDKLGPYDYIDVCSLKTSNIDDSLSYIIESGNRNFVYKGNNKSGPYGKISDYYYSHDGLRLVCEIYNQNKYTLYIDGVIKGISNNSSEVLFSDDNKNYAFKGDIDSNSFIYFNDEKIGPFKYCNTIDFIPKTNILCFHSNYGLGCTIFLKKKLYISSPIYKSNNHKCNYNRSSYNGFVYYDYETKFIRFISYE